MLPHAYGGCTIQLYIWIPGVFACSVDIYIQFCTENRKLHWCYHNKTVKYTDFSTAFHDILTSWHTFRVLQKHLLGFRNILELLIFYLLGALFVQRWGTEEACFLSSLLFLELVIIIFFDCPSFFLSFSLNPSSVCLSLSISGFFPSRVCPPHPSLSHISKRLLTCSFLFLSGSRSSPSYLCYLPGECC